MAELYLKFIFGVIFFAVALVAFAHVLPFILLFGGIALALRLAGSLSKKKVREWQEQEDLEYNQSLQQYQLNFNKLLADIQCAEETIHMLAEDFDIIYPLNYSAAIADFVEVRRTNSLNYSKDLMQLLKKQSRHARNFLQSLEQTHKLYTQVSALYKEVARDVKRSGESSIMEELDFLDDTLHGSGMRVLLTQKRWEDFFEYMLDIRTELERLRELMRQYHQNETTNQSHCDNDRMTEEKAYRILDISPDISKDRLKKIWKKWAEFYHPDSGYNPNEERMKAINQAYQYLITHVPKFQ